MLNDDGRRSRTRITGVGVDLPEQVVTTAEVEERAGLPALGFANGWLERVTGVRERRWAAPDVRPSDLAGAAARRALDAAGVAADTVDTLLFCGITRDFIEPATSNVVQALVGATNARVFDLTNACNGVIDGLDVADALIQSGKARRVLITTGERATISINWRARTPDEVMQSVAGLVVGDGGGALLVEPSDDPDRGFRERVVRSDGSHWALAVGGRFRPTTQACEICGSTVDLRFLCHGRELFEVGLAMMPPTMAAAMERTGWGYDDLDLVLCHEASKRFVETGMADLGDGRHPGPKIWSTVERFGNTSTVSLPLAMREALDAGALAPGARVLALGGSSGVSMAAMTLVW
ncbi:MAG TPA: ketoacyl-ACP synthase III [Candidatus Binatia bacterium]|jgi:3-oxoacyl-[acyl-carrier-protein] synthase-3|nr:ketoacyl-ACP synthase III [Candidatus Binatia bacterium]